MNTVVLKYGGSSVSSVEKMKALAQRILQRRDAGLDVVVVVSAMGKTTNHLLELAHEASSSPSKREIDLLLSTGEQVSISLFSMILNDMGYPAIGLTGTQAGIKTKGLHTRNTIEDIDVSRIQKHLSEGKIVLVAGFQGVNALGDITTLGRGGSDTTAVALASKLACNAEIYTDVQGIYGVDPRLYPNANKLDFISFEEMKEMAFLGAKVMEPRSIEIAHRFNTAVYVGSAHEDVPGTWIKESDASMEEKSISGLSVSENVMMVNVRKLPAQAKHMANLFIRLAENDINVDMITQSQHPNGMMDVAFTTSLEELDMVQSVLKTITDEVPQCEWDIDQDCVKVSVVGIGMRTQTGVAAKLFALLSDADIGFKLVTTSEISISYTLSKKDKLRAVDVIAEHFHL
ncbi:MAG TPA: aspartate kinase [Erysipelotrichaceae bacterium]|nr:aspartate kinase [Erysipelotrichaceae bacterium]